MRAARAAALVALGSALGIALGCATKPLPLEFSSNWPSDPPSLEIATKTWTRTAEHRGGFDTDVELIVSVDATFRSPQWRAAYVDHLSKLGDLSKTDVEALKAEQQKDAAEHHEFALLISTHDRRINDFAKNDRSSWQVRLRNASGQEVAPIRIYKDRRPPTAVAAELPHLGPFDEIYIAEFPPDIALLDDKKFSLAIYGSRGSVEIVWTSGS